MTYKLPETLFPIGYKYVANNKRKDVCTVVDYLTTTNKNGDIVGFRYVATHVFLGQVVTDYDVVHFTIQRAKKA